LCAGCFREKGLFVSSEWCDKLVIGTFNVVTRDNKKKRRFLMKFSSKRFYLLSVFLTVLLFAVSEINCRSQEKKISVNSQPPQTIQIGLIPGGNVFKQKERYETITAYLSKKTGAKIELKFLSAYGNIIDNFNTLGLDGAFWGSFLGILACEKVGTEPLARPELTDGTSTYYGLMFVRKDSGIKNAADMRGKRFVFVDRTSTAGWLIPQYYFKTHGIDDYHSFFRETYFAGTHEGAISDVLEKVADIGAAKNTIFYHEAETNPRVLKELTILAKSPLIPVNCFCVTKHIADPLKYKLKEALLNMDRDEEGKEVLKIFRAARFIETSKEDFNLIFEYVDKIGLYLKDYDCTND
jgi:phosphonate transport system substrate-binding protein